MKAKHKRLIILLAGLAALGAAVFLVLNAFEENIVFFFSPSEVEEQGAKPGRTIRLGGLVEEGSVERGPDAAVSFKVTDLKHDIRVSYRGILPDLFREGQGVIAEGKLLSDGSFQATSVLAKHDEKYMPPEVAAALKKSGRWQEGPRK
ncbi:MAG: cytochrome c maturation protein CcmE [Alphaproteobacteria bacterium]